MQNPQINLQDGELQAGLVYADMLGLPRPVTGAFASVYRLKCAQRDLALRCFLRNILDQELRYEAISSFVRLDNLPYTVTFDLLPKGVQVQGNWFPALKMEWVEGESLDHYILSNLTHPEKLERLAQNFLKMMNDLKDAGIAHGDLQHGNIMVLANEEIRLVDYDGMYVPALQHMQSYELGHRNYQHPLRGAEHFSAGMDNFSAWVIYTSIVGLQIDSKLWYQLAAGDDCLLFRQSDYLNPQGSPAFAALENHNDSRLSSLGRFLRAQAANVPTAVPHLQSPVPSVENLAPLAVSAMSIRRGPRVISSSLPDWLRDENVDLLHARGGEQQLAPTTHHVPPPPAKWIDPTVQQQAATQHGPAQHGAVQHAHKSPAAKPGPTHSLEPELLRPVPRKVEYNTNSDVPRPMAFQWLMLINPFLWAAIFYLSQVIGPDEDLLRNGKDYKATIANAATYTIKGGQKRLRIDYVYAVDGDSYYGTASDLSVDYGGHLDRGNTIWVHASPNNPSYTEPYSLPVGTRKTLDSATSMFFLVICGVFELLIWWPPFFHRAMAQSGEAVLAEVVGKYTQAVPKGGTVNYIELDYCLKDRIPRTVKLSVSAAQYNRLKKGDVISVLCNSRNPHSVIIYRYCRYRCI